MRWSRPLLIAVMAAAGCGRLAFDPLAGEVDAPADAASGGGAPRLVSAATTSSANGTSLQLTTSIGAGDLALVAIVLYNASGTVTSVVDNAGAYTFVSAGAAASSPDARCELWYAANTAPSTAQITATMTTKGGALWVADFANVAVTVPLDATGIGNGVAAPVVTGAPVATTSPGELAVSVIAVSAGGVTDMVAGNPFVDISNISGDDLVYAVPPQPGSYTAMWNQAGGGTTCSSSASFRPAP